MNDKEVANRDFEAFKKDISWFIKPSTKVTFKSQDLRISEEFKQTFPALTELIASARVTFLEIDSISYILFAWDSDQGSICGWLNKLEEQDSHSCELITEHEVLLRNIGGIRESFNQPENSFSNNQNFMFIGSECSIGIGDWDDYYSMTCEEDGFKKIDYSNYVAFVYEANGALTLYDRATKRVFLFSHDHSFDIVEFIENQPKYTFHCFKNVVTFVDYVEELAKQWSRVLKK